MILPTIQGNTALNGNYFYFAADEKYFDLYGKALAKSLLVKAAWAKVHVHLYNPRQDQLEWCKANNITASYESIDTTYKEFNTYCACVRFIRIPEIFLPTAKIISFDCDVIANQFIPKEKFEADTIRSKVTIKKNGQSLASAITFGTDNFRNLYSQMLIEKFLKDEIYWFLDQDTLDVLINNKSVATMGFDWTGTKMTDKQMIWTAKGDRKNSKQQYIDLVNYYNSKINNFN